ncbi:hypothetical protein K3725_15305 [Leisingera sp. S132]|uniref:hypothetical protein n=1 Tax=Leisingera sp. S132 TaxID=2867016 RepID=UPI0021A72663|nr:hypothetical protein [Leisingera sp. S132]UWQ78662.1 hypothetical protein K3725_15305 [Leisingera sp. S132]
MKRDEIIALADAHQSGVEDRERFFLGSMAVLAFAALITAGAGESISGWLP